MWFFIGLLLCAYALWYWNLYMKGNKGLKQPPFLPWVVPFIGHIHLIVGTGVRLWETSKWITLKVAEMGGVARFAMGFNVYYIITDPEDVLTAANACLHKHYTYEYAYAWLGDGLVTGSGDIWKRHRRLLTPAFSLPIIHSFLGVFNSQARKLVKNIQPEVNSKIDQLEHLRNINLETFCMTSFGIEENLANKEFTKKYMESVDGLLAIIMERFRSFWLHPNVLFKLFGRKKKFDDLISVVNKISSKVIQKKKAARNSNFINNSGARSYKVFLDLLLELSGDNTLTDKEIREEIDTAIAAGFDTSSSLLTFLLIILGCRPEVQDKLYREVKEIFPTDRDVEPEDIAKLVYMEAVIKETLSVYTTVPSSMRRVDKNVQLKNYTMRAGTLCILFLYRYQKPESGKYSDLFNAERWLHGPTPPLTGFSVGKRSCLGKSYAMISMKTTLVHFIKRYKVRADDSNLKITLDFVVKPISGHEIYIEDRNEE